MAIIIFEKSIKKDKKFLIKWKGKVQ